MSASNTTTTDTRAQLLLASLSSFPPAFGVDLLADLIDKTPAAILADRSRAPHRVPPACLPYGTQKPVWLLADVVAWLAEHREAPVEAPAVEPALRATRSRGRPTKAEAARRSAAAQEGGAV